MLFVFHFFLSSGYKNSRIIFWHAIFSNVSPANPPLGCLNISVNSGWFAIKVCTNIHSTQKMNPLVAP